MTQNTQAQTEQQTPQPQASQTQKAIDPKVALEEYMIESENAKAQARNRILYLAQEKAELKAELEIVRKQVEELKELLPPITDSNGKPVKIIDAQSLDPQSQHQPKDSKPKETKNG